MQDAIAILIVARRRGILGRALAWLRFYSPQGGVLRLLPKLQLQRLNQAATARDNFDGYVSRRNAKSQRSIIRTTALP